MLSADNSRMHFYNSKKQNAIPEKDRMVKVLFFLKIYSGWCIFTFSKTIKESVDGLVQDPATLTSYKNITCTFFSVDFECKPNIYMLELTLDLWHIEGEIEHS